MRIAVDAGYGYTKAAAETGRRSHFPSAVAPARGTGELAQALGGAAPKHRVSVDVARDTGHDATGDWLVGDAALIAGAARTWDAASGRRDYDVLTLTAAAAVGPEDGEEIELAAGLPLAVWLDKSERRALRERLTGLSAWVYLDGQDGRFVRIAEATVWPQALGAYLAALSSSAGGRFAGRMAAVVDIGHRTTDYLLLHPGEGGAPVPDETRSGSLDAGMNRVYAQVAAEVVTGALAGGAEGLIERELRAGRGVLPVRGRDVDIRTPYEAACRALAGEIADHLARVWADRLDYLAAVIVAGGGGAALWPWLHGRLPAAVLAPDAAFANAAGFLTLAGARV